MKTDEYSTLCIVILSFWAVISDQAVTEHYHMVLSIHLLQRQDCLLYATSTHQQMRSKLQCASICTAILECFHYVYDNILHSCIFCIHRHGGNLAHHYGLKTFSKDITTELKIYEKDDLLPLGSCSDVGVNLSGVYTLTLTDGSTVQVYCDMETSGGGWMVFQRRMNGSISFARTWNEYKEGFGDVSGEFWFGNELLSKMTAPPNRYRLRVDLTSYSDGTRYAEYGDFIVNDESDQYRLRIGQYSGNSGDGGDGLSYHNGMQFSTKDRDNDRATFNCAIKRGHGGFWYRSCDNVNTNSAYKHTAVYGDDVIQWEAWLGELALKAMEMKFRPMDYQGPQN